MRHTQKKITATVPPFCLFFSGGSSTKKRLYILAKKNCSQNVSTIETKKSGRQANVKSDVAAAVLPLVRKITDTRKAVIDMASAKGTHSYCVNSGYASI